MQYEGSVNEVRIGGDEEGELFAVVSLTLDEWDEPKVDLLVERRDYDGCVRPARGPVTITFEGADDMAGLLASRGPVGERVMSVHNTPSDGRLALPDAEPWPEGVQLRAVLDDLVALLHRYIAFTDNEARAVALWITFTHAYEAAFIAPILGITSATKGCGKTTLLEMLHGLVRRPVIVSNLTGPVLYRLIEKRVPTLLIDEADTFLPMRQELTGILNSGHTKSGAQVLRTVGTEYEVRAFSTWCPKAIAMIGELPDTLDHRAIPVRLRRALPGERKERLRLDRLGETLEPYRRKLARWALDNVDTLTLAEPILPEEMGDRAQDNWRLLLAIADAAGDEWGRAARVSARSLSGTHRGDNSAQVQLLSDVRIVLEAWPADRISSHDLLDRLVALEGRPWADTGYGKPLNQHRLSRMLRAFSGPDGLPLGTRDVWFGDWNRKGYHVADFSDAFGRYLTDAREPRELAEHHEAPRGSIVGDALESSRNRERRNGNTNDLADLADSSEVAA
jgi:putative DNA primase/helicase